MSLGKAARNLVKPLRGVLQPSTSAVSRSYAAAAEARAVLNGELEAIRAAGTWKAERIITSKQGPHINVDGSRGSEWKCFKVTADDINTDISSESLNAPYQKYCISLLL